MELEIVYLSHQDFQRLMYWTLLQELYGTFQQQINEFNRKIANCDVKKDYKQRRAFIIEKASFVRKYLQCYFWQDKICVDTDTGQVYTPKTANL